MSHLQSNGKSLRTWTFVQEVGLSNVAFGQTNSLANLRSLQHLRRLSGQDGVQIGSSSERVASVVHDAGKIVGLSQRVDFFRCQLVEIVLLTCKLLLRPLAKYLEENKNGTSANRLNTIAISCGALLHCY